MSTDDLSEADAAALNTLVMDLSKKAFDGSKQVLDDVIDSFKRVGSTNQLSVRKFILQASLDCAALNVANVAASLTFTSRKDALSPDAVLFGSLLVARYVNDARKPPGVSTIQLMAFAAESFHALTGRHFDFGHEYVNKEVRGLMVGHGSVSH